MQMTTNELQQENDHLRMRLEEAEETLRAIRTGEVDALIVSSPEGEKVYTLQSAELPYRVLVERMQEGAVTLSADGTILYCNLRFAAMLNVPHAKLITTNFRDYTEIGSLTEFDKLFQIAASDSARGEITFTVEDGSKIHTIVSISRLPQEVEGYYSVVVTDLTEMESLRRNQVEIQGLNEQLRRSMRETHHRVKNNLQIIAALVDLEVAEAGATIATSKLRRIALHAQALGAVHDLITRDVGVIGEAMYVSCKDVLETLVGLLRKNGTSHHFELQIEDLQLTAKQGSSLALVVGEIITNAMKYGRDLIKITLKVNGQTANILISDDGDGFPNEFDVKKSGSTGLDLVEQVARWDLSGTVSYHSLPQGGASVMIQMPIPQLQHH